VILAGLLLLILASCLCAALLRAAGARGTCGHPAILGGLVAGALLGPTLLGRLAPNLHEDLFVGARPERERWSAAAAEAQAQSVAESALGFATAAPQEFGTALVGNEGAGTAQGEARPALSPEEDAAERAWRRGAWEAQWPQRALSVLLAAALLFAPVTLAGHRPALQGRRSKQAIPTSVVERSRRIDALLIGIWSAGLPALGGVLLLWLQDRSLIDQSALWFLAALAVGPWALDAVDRRIADESEPDGARLMAGSRVMASLVAASLLLLAAAAAPSGEFASLARSGATVGVSWLDRPSAWATVLGVGMATLLALSVLPGRWLVARREVSADDAGAAVRDPMELPSVGPREAGAPSGSLPIAATIWLLPPLTALCVVRVELFRDLAPWLILGVVLLAGDGRAAGAFIGAVLAGGRPPLRALRLGLVAGNAAPSQVALVGAAATVGVLAPWATLALVVAAAFVEVTSSVRPNVARSIRELEDPPIDLT